MKSYKNVQILYCNVSIENIMINVEISESFLNDWNLCKYREDLEDGKESFEPSEILMC